MLDGKKHILKKNFIFIIGVNHNWLLNENSIPLIRL